MNRCCCCWWNCKKGKTSKGRTQCCHSSWVYPLCSADLLLFTEDLSRWEVRAPAAALSGTFAVSTCRAGKVSLINLKMKTPFTIESNFCRISDLLGCWIWVWGLNWCPRPASHTFNLIQQLAKVNNTSKEVNTWGTSRGKKMNKSYLKTNETMTTEVIQSASQAGRDVSVQWYIFRLLARSEAAVLTPHKWSDSAAGSRAVHQGQKKKKKFTLWNLLKAWSVWAAWSIIYKGAQDIQWQHFKVTRPLFPGWECPTSESRSWMCDLREPQR